MPLVSDNFHQNKLKKYNINIKTKYIVDNKILERNTDINKINDDIKKGIRCQKEYFIKDKLVHTENIFDTRIEYTFISKSFENKDYQCPNCGMTSKLKDFLDGCPYCKTYYNIDYIEKDLGSKYHYDLILQNTTYRIITAFIDLIISLLLAFFFIKFTSRTFNSYDITKVFIYGIVLSLILYYFFYIIDGYIVLGPIKKYKDRENQKQIAFWERTKIDKKNFFNNLNYEIRKKYYSQENIIDYDIIDYLNLEEYTKDNHLFVRVKASVRIVYYNNGKIVSKLVEANYLLKRINEETLKLNGEVNIIKCHNCGASIDATKGKCDYCHSEIKYLQEWIMIELKE